MRILGRSLGHVARLAIALSIPALLLAWLVPTEPLHVPEAVSALEIVASRIDTLRFQLGVMLALSTVWLLLSRAWRFAALGVLLTAWAVLPALTWPAVERSPRAGAQALRVMSINLGGTLGQLELVEAAIHAGDADVVVLQEYTPRWQRRVAARWKDDFPFREERPRTDNFGMAVFSRVAWARAGSFELTPSGTPQLRLVFRHDGLALVLYCVHLLPPIHEYYLQHRAEFVDLVRRISAETQPTALVGDFNFVDHGRLAPALHERGFHDAHGLAGSGRGATWPVNGRLRYVPGIRIDHIYLGTGLTSTAAWVGEHTGSDHLPVGCAIVPAETGAR